MKVYVAGPLGPNDTRRGGNVQRAIEAGIVLANAGHSPFVPHLMHYFEGHTGAEGLDYEDYMRVDFEWLAACGAMIRLPGDSPGADRERVFAEERSIPVFHSVERFLAR